MVYSEEKGLCRLREHRIMQKRYIYYRQEARGSVILATLKKNISEKGNAVARWRRKTTGLSQTAGLPELGQKGRG